MANLRRLLLGLAACAGCGDPLFDGGFSGTPLWRFSGTFEVSAGTTLVTARPRVALFFSLQNPVPARPTQTPEGFGELRGASTQAALGESFVLNVFEPPSANLLLPGTAYGFGRLVAYDDRDGDGHRGPDEPIVGYEVFSGFVYAPQPLADGQGPGLGALPAGLSRVILPLRCGQALPATPAGPCDLSRLGSVCQKDNECGANGRCLLADGIPWPGGACVIPERAPGGCVPSAAQAVYKAPAQGMTDPNGNAPTGFYLKPCQQDAECRRDREPVANLYRCDQALKACAPNGDVRLALGQGTELPGLSMCGYRP